MSLSTIPSLTVAFDYKGETYPIPLPALDTTDYGDEHLRGISTALKTFCNETKAQWTPYICYFLEGEDVPFPAIEIALESVFNACSLEGVVITTLGDVWRGRNSDLLHLRRAWCKHMIAHIDNYLKEIE